MKATNLIECLDAAHLTNFVESEFDQRGGIMIVGPPGQLKTSILKLAFRDHPNALLLSDLNINSLSAMRDSLVSGRYSTVYFPEYEKLYQRKAETAANVEGVIKQLVEEGFTKFSFESQEAITATVRTFVAGAITPAFYNKNIQKWLDGGVARRFLWVSIRLENPELIFEAIRKDKKVDFGGVSRRYPTCNIPMNVTEKESIFLEKMLREQHQATPYVLMKKILSVLKWKHKGSRRAMEIVTDFCEAIQLKYAPVELK